MFACNNQLIQTSQIKIRKDFNLIETVITFKMNELAISNRRRSIWTFYNFNIFFFIPAEIIIDVSSSVNVHTNKVGQTVDANR